MSLMLLIFFNKIVLGYLHYKWAMITGNAEFLCVLQIIIQNVIGTRLKLLELLVWIRSGITYIQNLAEERITMSNASSFLGNNYYAKWRYYIFLYFYFLNSLWLGCSLDESGKSYTRVECSQWLHTKHSSNWEILYVNSTTWFISINVHLF